jgi:Ser/Thr protein kinase RdoA (MazF antagonist)
MRIIHGDLHQWNVRCVRGRLAPIDFEDLMWGWPVQDIATTLYYSADQADFAEMRAAFELGYRRVGTWPERYPGEIEAFMAARALGMMNFVLQSSAGFDLAAFAERLENRLRRWMAAFGVDP